MRPEFNIVFDNQDITRLVQDRVISITIQDQNGVDADSATIRLADKNQEIEPPSTGARIDISFGYVETGVTSLGAYVVDEVRLSGMPNVMEISAKSADFKSEFKEQKSKVYDEATLRKIVEETAKSLEMEPVIGDIGDKQVDHIDQTNESNMHFLTRLGERYDAVVKPVNGKLTFQKHGEAKNSSGQAPEPVNIDITQCLEWSAVVADYPRYGSVKARTYDKDKAQYVEKTAGEGSPSKTLKQTYPTEQEAQDASDAEMDRLNRGTGEFRLTIVGNPIIRAEMYINATGFHRAIDGRWLITEVTHEMGAGGYTTAILCNSEKETGGDGSEPTQKTMSYEEMKRRVEEKSKELQQPPNMETTNEEQQ